MLVKEYKLSRTKKKTAKDNNLEISGEYLFDFSQLDETELTEDEKEFIKERALKHITAAFTEEFYGKEVDDFLTIDGYAKFIPHQVLPKEGGHRLYCIMQLDGIKHTRSNRKSVWDEWKNEILTYKPRYNEPMFYNEI